MCFSSHLDTFDSPFGGRCSFIRLRNLLENKILMEPLREFDIAINRAGVSSATAANQGVPPARAMTIAPKTKPEATEPIPANGTKREASNRSSSIVHRPRSTAERKENANRSQTESMIKLAVGVAGAGAGAARRVCR